MLNFVRLWIFLSAALVAGGWVLSACHALNRVGYGILFALTGALLLFYLARHKAGPFREPIAQKAIRLSRKLKRRFRRPLPLLLCVLSFLSLIGAALYVSTDGDALAYRTPRTLHWLWAQQWCWIPTTDFRLNNAGCNFEWLTAPLILFTRTDRFVFLINWLSYLLLPGLIYSVFIRLGVSRRVAWWWAWLLPSGWCFVLQSGSVSNDSISAVFALAAIDLALRAREQQSIRDLCLSLLATGLITGIKQTNIPLALLGLIAAWPCRHLLLRRPLISLGASVMAVLVSILPTCIFNLEYTGKWTGIPMVGLGELNSPLWGILGNAFCLPAQNLAPPFFLWADRWDHSMQTFLTTPLGHHFSSFERFGFLSHGLSTGSAGIGMGISCLVLLSLIIAALRGRSAIFPVFSQVRLNAVTLWLLRLMPWPLLLIFMAKVGTFTNARHLAPYYPFFFPLLLAMPVHVQLLRRIWWRSCCLLVMATTALVLVVSRERPLFPINTVVAGLEAKHPHSRLVSQMKNSYAFRSAFERLRNLFPKTIPATESTVGYLTAVGFAEPGLGLPFGRLKVDLLLPDDTPDQVRSRQIHYVVVDDIALEVSHTTIENWLTQYHGHVVDQCPYYRDPYLPPHQLYLVHLD